MYAYLAKSVKMQSSNTLSQDTAFDRGRSSWNDDTQLLPPSERQHSQHGTVRLAVDKM